MELKESQPAKTKTRVSKEQDSLCGCGPCKPSCLQGLANPKLFIFNAFFIGLMITSLAAYLSGIIPILERQFNLSSSQSGSLTIINDIVALLLVIFVSHFGHRSHRPRWIATGGVLLGVGTLMCAIPHFTTDPVDPSAVILGSSRTSNNLFCSSESNSNSTDGCQTEKTGYGSTGWIIIGQAVAGIGLAPYFPLVATYIEDSVGKKSVLSYMTFIYMSYGLGPLAGFALSAVSSRLYVDFNRIDSEDIPAISQNDPRWIGAWWLGFIILGILIILISIPLYFFPRVMPRKINNDDEKELEPDDDVTCNSSERTDVRAIIKPGSNEPGLLGIIKGVFWALKRILANFTLVIICLSVSCDAAIVSAVGTFIVKYIVTQFAVSPSNAAIFVGIIVPANIFSHFVSAGIIRRLKLNIKQCARMVVIIKTITLPGFPILMFLVGCSNRDIAGVTVPYSSQSSHSLASPTIAPLCNYDCSCSEELFRPVCGSNGITYTSPCNAGCTHMNETLIQNETTHVYLGCDCTEAAQEAQISGDGFLVDTSVPYAVEGQCEHSCKLLPVYLAFLWVLIFFNAMATQPTLYLTLRVVDKEDRSLALGFKTFTSKCLGFLPSPVYFGAAINGTCLLWRYQCGQRGNCWIHDNDQFRLVFNGLFLGLKVLSLIVFIIAYVSIKEEPKEDEQDASNKVN